MLETFFAADEREMRQLGFHLAPRFKKGDLVLFYGDLGAGKTTLIRGIVAVLGHREGVRSPTFNLIQVFETDPPVMHADLYRLKSHEGIGLEDYLDSHLCLIEWPDRAATLVEGMAHTDIHIHFEPNGRRIELRLPAN